ncbi:hypothetical protein D9M70_611400 [compost metagenome]
MNRVSPVNTVFSDARWKQVEPGEWPGVWIASRVAPPTVNTSPSAIPFSGVVPG